MDRNYKKKTDNDHVSSFRTSGIIGNKTTCQYLYSKYSYVIDIGGDYIFRTVCANGHLEIAHKKINFVWLARNTHFNRLVKMVI